MFPFSHQYFETISSKDFFVSSCNFQTNLKFLCYITLPLAIFAQGAPPAAAPSQRWGARGRHASSGAGSLAAGAAAAPFFNTEEEEEEDKEDEEEKRV